MLYVLDTNILVASLSATSSEHWVITKLLKEEYQICVSSEILLEYEEVLNRKYGIETTHEFIQALDQLPNVHKVDIHFK